MAVSYKLMQRNTILWITSYLGTAIYFSMQNTLPKEAARQPSIIILYIGSGITFLSFAMFLSLPGDYK